MAQNYLKAPESPQINAFLAAAGWNLKKMMRKLKNDTSVGVLIVLKTRHTLLDGYQKYNLIFGCCSNKVYQHLGKYLMTTLPNLMRMKVELFGKFGHRLALF